MEKKQRPNRAIWAVDYINKFERKLATGHAPHN